VLDYALARVTASGRVAIGVAMDDSDAQLDLTYPGAMPDQSDLRVFERGPAAVGAGLLDLAVARRIVTDVGGELVAREGGFLIRVPLFS
jgi:hypothetical protein